MRRKEEGSEKRWYHYYSFFLNDTPTTEIYSLSLHDALPICLTVSSRRSPAPPAAPPRRRDTSRFPPASAFARDRKSTRLNSSHANISYAVFCLKKKTNSLLPLSTFTPSRTVSIPCYTFVVYC